jgi:hypothetical protein
MADPVSWLVVERGWKVLAADGQDVGRVEEIIGDSGNDIFNGLAISTGLLKGRRYVPSERVAEIVEGAVRLDLDGAAVERLDEHEEPPPSAEIRPE